MNIHDVLKVLLDGSAFHNGELVIKEEFVTNYLREKVNEPRLKRLQVRFLKQHCVLDLDAEVALFLLRWVSSWSLRQANLNSHPRYVLFEQPNNGRVEPLNFAAKSALVVAKSLLAVPIVGGLVAKMVRCLLDEIAKPFLTAQVASAGQSIGFTADGKKWKLDLSSDEWTNHPAFTPVTIPGIGKRTLLGGVLVVRRIDLLRGAIRIQPRLHPSLSGWMTPLGTIAQRLSGWFPVLGSGSETRENKRPADRRDDTKSSWIPPIDDLFETVREIAQGRRPSEQAQEPPLVDEAWIAELESAPLLDVLDLGVKDAHRLEPLDMD